MSMPAPLAPAPPYPVRIREPLSNSASDPSDHPPGLEELPQDQVALEWGHSNTQEGAAKEGIVEASRQDRK